MSLCGDTVIALDLQSLLWPPTITSNYHFKSYKAHPLLGTEGRWVRGNLLQKQPSREGELHWAIFLGFQKVVLLVTAILLEQLKKLWGHPQDRKDLPARGGGYSTGRRWCVFQSSKKWRKTAITGWHT